MSNEKIKRIKKRIVNLENKIKKDQQSLRKERDNLKEEIDKDKVKKVDDLLLYFNDLDIDMTLDELVKRIKNDDLNLQKQLESKIRENN